MFVLYCALYPAYKAGIPGALPVKNSPSDGGISLNEKIGYSEGVHDLRPTRCRRKLALILTEMLHIRRWKKKKDKKHDIEAPRNKLRGISDC
jgi:hypothetical protein